MYEKKYYRLAFGLQSLVLVGFGIYGLFFAYKEQEVFVLLLGLQGVLGGLPFAAVDVHTKQKMKDVVSIERTYALAFFMSHFVVMIVWMYQASSVLLSGNHEGVASIFSFLTTVPTLTGKIISISLFLLQRKKEKIMR